MTQTVNIITEYWESTFEDENSNPIGFKAKIDYCVHPDKPGYIIENLEVSILDFTTENQESIRESLRYLVSEFFHGARLEWNTEIKFKN